MRTASGLTSAISNAMEAKRVKVNAPFNKYLAISNPANGAGFLEEVNEHLIEFSMTSFVGYTSAHLQYSFENSIYSDHVFSADWKTLGGAVSS